MKAGLGLLGLLLVAGVVVRGWDWRGMIDSGLEHLRAAGPVTFFGAMAILPAAGFPMAAFLFVAVPLFGPVFGTTTTVLLALGAATVNFCLAYAMARRGLRPLLKALLERLGYRVPLVEDGDATDLVILLRVTPGVPYVVQNYLAGLAEVPFGRYVLVSVVIGWPLIAVYLLFGDAILHGKGQLAWLAGSGLAALLTLAHLVRRHYEKRRLKP
ncbi:MAG: VTT domain-containing protein [Candidatus Didemnitutus sp.]|nr:VTT domain-containing protein [Candidatus Didemnitutus sp.]